MKLFATSASRLLILSSLAAWQLISEAPSASPVNPADPPPANVIYKPASGPGLIRVPAEDRDPDQYEAGEVAPGEFLVRFRRETVQRGALRLTGDLPGSVRFLRPLNRGNRGNRALQNAAAHAPVIADLAIVQVAPNADVKATLRQLRAHPDILYAEPNLRLRLFAEGDAVLPDDFDFSQLWGLNNTGQSLGKDGADVDAPEAWAIATGSREVKVAVIDTGIDYNHPDLAENMWENPRDVPGNGLDDDGNGYIDDWRGYDFVSQDSDPFDDHSHGTHVAGTIGASGNNQTGISGMCWTVSLMAVKSFDEAGGANLDHVIEGIQYAVENGARIINASWGTSLRSRALQEIIVEANEAGVLFIAAAGNDRSENANYPAAYPFVLAVAATDHKDQRAGFSNYGSYVDVAAPGEGIFSTLPDNTYGFFNGTSMATPHVAGLAALILSRRPEFTHRQVEEVLLNTSDEITPDRYIGRGRINAGRAMQVDAPLPTARLTLPSTLEGIIRIDGSAFGEGFAGYSLEYGRGIYPTNWVQFFSSDTPVRDGTLCPAFSTDALEEGIHTIKLIVRHSSGHAALDRVSVPVRNASISFPMTFDILRAGEAIPIRGTVFGPGRTFTVEHGVGWEPSVWSNLGMALAGGGREQRLNDVLATWDTRLMETNQFYTLKLTARAGTNAVAEHRIHLVYLDGFLKSGWPRYIPIAGEYPPEDWRHFKVADLDGDGSQEIILVDHGNVENQPARLLVYGADGALRWSRELASGAPYADIPVVGDVDGDGRLEIFVDAGSERQLFAFHHDGSPLAGRWPVRLDHANAGKVLADLNGDGKLELIAYLHQADIEFGFSERQLVVFNITGDALRKWNLISCSETTDAAEMIPAVGNLDDDPDLEIVAIAGCNQIGMYDLANASGPVWTAVTESTLLGSPAIGDLDNDGRNEIVLGAFDESKSPRGGLYAFDRHGKVLPGWPVLLQESFSSAPALGDFDGDDDLEICIASWPSQKIHLIHHHGFEAAGWPVELHGKSHIKTSLVIGDINGDGRPDAVAASPGNGFVAGFRGDLTSIGGVKAWNGNGEPIDLNPHPQVEALPMESSAGIWQKTAPVALTDLNADGRLEIVASSIQDRTYTPLGETAVRKHRSSLYVWELPAPFSESSMPWPMFQKNSQHTAYLPSTPRVNQRPVVAVIPDQTIAPGREFYPIDLPQYVEDDDHESSAVNWIVSGANQLELTMDRFGALRIRPKDPAWVGREELLFTATDPGGLSAAVRAVFEVRADYNPPVAGADSATTPEDAFVELNVLLNDTHPAGAALMVSQISRPRNGSAAESSPGVVRYEPAEDFFGTDTFRYTIIDGNGGMAQGAVTVTVTPVNDPPEAVGDRVITGEDQPVWIAPLENDLDADGDTIELLEFGTALNGSLQRRSNGMLLYTPSPDFFGVDQFEYSIADGQSEISTNLVSVMVKPVNDAPVAEDQEFTVNQNARQNFDYLAKDADEDKLTFRVVEGPAHGILWSYPTVGTYYPHKNFTGSDRFTYVANDGQVDSLPATVTLTVLDVNNPPEVTDRVVATKPDQPLQIFVSGKDVDEDPLMFQIVAEPKWGRLIGQDTNYTYTPNPGFLGTDQFRFQAFDGKTNSADGTIEINVSNVNTPPLAADFTIHARVNTATNITLVASDGENDPLDYELMIPTVNGQLTGQAPTLTYTPRVNFRGFDRFTFRVSDGEFESRPGVVTISVNFDNHPPQAKPQTVTLARNETALFELQVDDEDGDPLDCPILKGPRHGRISGRGKSFAYRPQRDFVGADSFTYKAWDGFNYSNKGEISITILPFVPEVVPPEFESVQLLGDGTIRLTLKTQPGERYEVSASTDLLQWTVVGQATASGDRTTITDSEAGRFSFRFYRFVRN